jgi:hypothetical protein
MCTGSHGSTRDMSHYVNCFCLKMYCVIGRFCIDEVVLPRTNKLDLYVVTDE